MALSPEVGVIPDLQREQIGGRRGEMSSLLAFLKCSEAQGGISNDAREEKWAFIRHRYILRKS